MNYPPRQWLKHQTTIKEAEVAFRAEAQQFGLPLSPDWLSRWKEFKAQLLAEDELWYFEHFPEAFSGAAGYCILREGKSIASIGTKRS